ncbi:MAG: hypothetical protein JJ974_07205 [Phycisphaerales bacterium]|nr:hypothetical protein [Phycisphaerales bacterium]
MRQVISILLIQALVLLPFQGYALSERCCGIGNELQTSASELTSDSIDGCCFGMNPESEQSSVDTESDQEYPDSPCQDGECPSRCCTAVAHPACVLPSLPGMIESRLPDFIQSLSVEIDLPQPHLLQLKRPPRLV